MIMTDERSQELGGFDWSHAGNRRRQQRAGLEMTPAERLEWLEQVLDELLPLVGRARDAGKRTETSGS
jgi:hypothetical protein